LRHPLLRLNREKICARLRKTPIADLISVPFQNNTNFDIGHSDNTQNVLNIQPVYPTHLNQTWNLITRPILPVISQPPFFSGRELAALEEIFGPGIGDTEFGLGDLTLLFAEKADKTWFRRKLGVGYWASFSVSNRDGR
jgi:hypothetical protein